MTAELELHQGDLGDKMNYAKALATSNLLPDAYKGRPENVLVAMEYGYALGLNPMVAINSIHVIKGKPTLSAQIVSALIKQAGHKVRTWLEQDANGDPVAITTIHRKDDPGFEFRSTWDRKRAVTAKLWGTGNWSTYPEAMLKSRSITDCGRDAVPEVLMGIAYTAEELGDDKGGTTLVEVGPPEKPVRLVDRARKAPAPQPAAQDDETAEVVAMINGTDDLEILRRWWKDWADNPDIKAALKARVDFVTNAQQGEPVDADVLEDPFPSDRGAE